jgi:hypothetical protein
MTLHSLALARKPHPDTLVTPDGAHAELVDEGISFFDAAGRLLIRYQDGALSVCPPKGDLVLGSATGAVRIAAASDVVIESKRDVLLQAPRRVTLSAAGEGATMTLDHKRVSMSSREVAVDADVTSIAGGDFEVTVDKVAMTAKSILQRAELWETAAAKTVVRTREMLQEVSGLFTERLGRFRGVVKEAYSLRTGRTELRSKEDTAIDGKRVLLG